MSEKIILDVYTKEQVRDIQTYARLAKRHEEVESEFTREAMESIQKRLGKTKAEILLLARIYATTATD